MSDGNPSPGPSPKRGGEKETPPSLLGKGVGGLGSEGEGTEGPGRILHFLVFLTFLSLWTWKLLEPIPVPPEVTGGLSREVKFALAKTLHVCGYAFLTLLAATLPVARHWRLFLVVLLLFHGIASEIGQSFIPNRTGKVTDVLLDWFGVVVGVVLVRWWERR